MRILTLDELYSFCKKNKIHKFSSNETGSQIVVSIPATFESDEYDDDTLLFARVKLMHDGVNRNKSKISNDMLHKAAKGLQYKPILANFMEYVDDNGETVKDFTSHDIIVNEDGTTTYVEHQIGCFTADEPYFETDEETGHNFLFGRCAIPREYTDAASIIERKNGTKISVELAINELRYDTKEGVLELADFVILGATCLGKNPYTLNDVEEGMKNARLDIEDFSIAKDSMKFDKDERIIELLEKVNTTLSNFNTRFFEKGGTQENMKFEELLAKYNKTAEDIDFDYSEMSDEELENKFAEMFEEQKVENVDESDEPDESDKSEDADSEVDEVNIEVDEVNDVQTETEVADEEQTQEVFDDEPADEGQSDQDDTKDDDNDEQTTPTIGEPPLETDPEPVPTSATDGSEDDDAAYLEKNKNKFAMNIRLGEREFALSLQEKIYALSDLVNATYADADNTWYGIDAYDDYVIMQDWCTGKYFRQSYNETDGVFSLVGDRIAVYAEFVTEEELNSLNEMRANYEALVQFKKDAEEVEETKYFSADKVKNSTVKVFANVNRNSKESRYGDLFKR